MNIILCHIGKQLPHHIHDCITQIRRVSPAKIYLVTDAPYEQNQGVEVVTLKSIRHNPLLSKISRKLYLKGFWDVTLRRLFCVMAVAKHLELKDILHIENDVLLLKNPMGLVVGLRDIANGGVALTPVGPKHASAAYMFSHTSEGLEELCEIMLTHIKYGEEILKGHIDSDSIDEMQVLAHIAQEHTAYIGYLPVLHSGLGSWHSSVFDDEFLFDGASYGQWLGGIPHKEGIPWAGRHHYVGAQILDENIKVEMGTMNGRPNPYVVQADNRSALCNLHVHAKSKMKEFME